MVGTGHDATLYFLGAPIVYSPWIEFPLSNERKSGFLTPVLGSSGIRGFEYAQPYYLNLAPNYDATIAPRLMTKRGLQIGRPGPLPVRQRPGRGDRRISVQRPRHRRDALGRVVEAHAEPRAFLPGLTGYWNLNKVSDDTYFADLADRVGLTSQTTLPREGGFTYTHAPWTVIARAQAFQTLVDPTLPPGPRPTTACRSSSRRCRKSTGRDSRSRAPPSMRTSGIRRSLPASALTRTRPSHGRSKGRRGTSRRGLACTRGITISTTRRRTAKPELCDSDLVARRRARLRARLERLRAELRADARASRLLRLRAVQGPDQGADLRHRDRRLQFRAALQPQPLSWQRPHRRCQSDHARRSRRGSSTRLRAQSVCASRSPSGSISRTSE